MSVLLTMDLLWGQQEPQPYYEIEAEARIQEGLIRGRARIIVPAWLKSGERLEIDRFSAGRDSSGSPLMRVEDVTLGASREATHWRAAGDRLEVAVEDPFPELVLNIDYTVPLSSQVLRTFGYHSVTGLPQSTWYPDLLSPDGSPPRFKDFRVSLTYPRGWTVVTTGAPEGAEVPVQPERLKRIFSARHVEGFSINLGKGFVLREIDSGEQRIVAFSSPEEAERYARLAELAADAIAWFRETYGFFPVPQIGILQGHPRWGGGFPLPNLFWIHRGKTDVEFLRWIVAHELGHYFWGLYVLGDQKRLDWLVLANGIWVDQLYIADRRGRGLDEQWRSSGSGNWYEDYVRAMVSNRQQKLGLTSQEEAGLDFDYNSLIRHGKGAVGLYLQARLLGAEKFLALQREIIDEYRHRPLSVGAFVAMLRDAGLHDAPDFFQAWQRDNATIGYTAGFGEVEKTADGWSYEVSVRKRGTVSYPVSIQLEDEEGGTLRRIADGTRNRQEFKVDSPLRLVALRVDPEGVLPMWQSSHPGMQRIFLSALRRERLVRPFFDLGIPFLSKHPRDFALRYHLLSQSVQAGEFAQAIDLLPSMAPAGCGDARQCRLYLYGASALARIGRTDEARKLLAAIENNSRERGLDKLWAKRSEEVQALSRR